MKVSELKKLLEDCPDDMDIVRPGPDHSFPLVNIYRHNVIDEGEQKYTDDVRAINPNQPGKPAEVLVTE